MAACSSPSEPPKPALTYPATTMGNVVEDYGGTKVADPYRWMESLDSPEVKAWITAQNAVTDPYLAALPHRKALNERLTALWDYPRVGLPSLEGGQMFYAKNSGLQQQAPIFRRDGIDKPPTLVIDPNVISEEGTVAFAEYKVSPDAKLMAYGLSEGGADWETIHVRDLGTGKDLADEVRWMRFSAISWTKDAKGFFYSRYPEPPKGKVLEAALSGHTLYYHRVGTPQSAGSARLRAEGSARLDHHRRRDRRRPLSAHLDVRGIGQQEPALRRGPRKPEGAQPQSADQAGDRD